MSVDKNFVLNALLQHNYLPTQKKDKEELPPLFTSTSFTPEVASKLTTGKQRAPDGYDAIEYRLTRFNGVSRSCSIPHPVAYAHLALCIHEHWEKLEYIAKNKNSLIRPRQHDDGRLIIMNYEGSLEKAQRSLQGAFGQRFMVHTDISNCFPSIYSHAIPWATVGFSHAKAHKAPKHKREWFNQLDEKVRWLKRNETQGIAIGPATSNIVSEIILARVDEELRDEFEFFRYIDDYTAYCESEDKAQKFVRRLSDELARYKLLLNINKTVISPLPQALTDGWIAELSLRLPKTDEINGYDAISYLNLAVQIARESPDGSVLKYALKSIIGRKLELPAKFDVLQYALTLSFHQTALLPLLESLFDTTLILEPFQYSEQLHRLLLENARFRRSDGMAWTLYYLNKYKVGIEKNAAEEVLASRDCAALILLYLSGETAYQAKVINFVKSLDPADLYELDQYWLLLYHLYCDGKITNLYTSEDAFETLRADNILFLEQIQRK